MHPAAVDRSHSHLRVGRNLGERDVRLIDRQLDGLLPRGPVVNLVGRSASRRPSSVTARTPPSRSVIQPRRMAADSSSVASAPLRLDADTCARRRLKPES